MTEPHDLPRLSRGELFMQVARLYGRRSSCPRADVGAIAVAQGRIIATGYCGSPEGAPHCIDVGCDMVGGHCIRSIHAEANLVAYAARTGTSLRGTYIYCTHAPCFACSQLLLQAGISWFIWEQPYRRNGLGLLERGGVKTSLYPEGPDW
jgi:dCMP deaminase